MYSSLEKERKQEEKSEKMKMNIARCSFCMCAHTLDSKRKKGTYSHKIIKKKERNTTTKRIHA